MTLTDRKLSEIVDGIYDAACEPGYEGLMRTLLDAFSGNSALTVVGDPVNGPSGEVFGIPPEILQPFQDKYWKMDPWAAVTGWTWHREFVLRGTDIVPPAKLMNTQYYDEFAKTIHVVRLMNVAFPIKPSTSMGVSIQRDFGDPEFTDEECADFEALIPHIKRSIQLKHRIHGGLNGHSGFAALHALAFGTIVCDGRSHIEFTNRAAEDIARSNGGIVLGKADKVLYARLPGEAEKLQSLIANAAQAGPGGALTLSGREGRRLYVLVTRLPARLAEKSGQALITLRPANARATVTEQQLMRLFGLTPAEARLAAHLVRGASLAELENRFGTAATTLKTQLAQVFIKTDAGNQRDLVRRLSLIPPVR